jgi:hypothetical protein
MEDDAPSPDDESPAPPRLRRVQRIRGEGLTTPREAANRKR